MKWELRLSRETVEQLYKIDRRLVANLWATLNALAKNPDKNYFQPTEADPSRYWIGIDGDLVISFEILDEIHAIRLLKIE